MLNFISTHPFETIFALYIFSTLVSALPAPLPSSRWYAFVYQVLHVFAANGLAFLQNKVPALSSVTETQTLIKTTTLKGTDNVK